MKNLGRNLQRSAELRPLIQNLGSNTSSFGAQRQMLERERGGQVVHYVCVYYIYIYIYIYHNVTIYYNILEYNMWQQ